VPGAQLPVGNGFRATLTNLSVAALDAARMDLDLSIRVEGTVTTDGASILTLTGVDRPVRVLLDGAEQRGAFRGRHVVVDLPAAGTFPLTLEPRG
jgi:hypothetical protein